MPLLGATLIAIIAFLPIFMSPDTAGVYTRDLFIVLAVSLLLSWVLALVHVPLMANRYLHPAVETNATGAREYKGRTYAVLRAALRMGLAHRWSFVLTMLVLLGLSAFGYQYMRQGFFPDMVYDQLYMEYKLPEGNNSTQVVQDLREIEAYLKTRKEVTHVTTSIGGTPGRYNLVRSIANPSLAYGELIIDFTSPEELVDNMDEIQSYLTHHYPNAYVKMKRYNLMFKNILSKSSSWDRTLPYCTGWQTAPAVSWSTRRRYASSPPIGNRRFRYSPSSTTKPPPVLWG